MDRKFNADHEHDHHHDHDHNHESDISTDKKHCDGAICKVAATKSSYMSAFMNPGEIRQSN
jgi:ABC-type Zn2+ transport system substrate-binding protein/surface adhesin